MGGIVILTWRIGVWIYRSPFYSVLMCRMSDAVRFLFSSEFNNQEWKPQLLIVDDSSPLNYDDGQCAICLGPHVKKSRTTCGHVFCSKCLVQWSRIKLECPTCKQSFNSTCKRNDSSDNFRFYTSSNRFPSPDGSRINIRHIFIEMLLIVLLPAALIGWTLYFAIGWLIFKALNHAASSQTILQYLTFSTVASLHGAVPLTGRWREFKPTMLWRLFDDTKLSLTWYWNTNMWYTIQTSFYSKKNSVI